ncbi:hypothetical protein [Endozoicomonas euniceicola]|uniref:Auto-transporter adhesin head GIN domain-containing protein n=1 Tax=Endozoicomonas euniceicola TaxID=1234143 RepID=A0ABY6GQ07_9GAMM|nr:hypothetical protein [Endozoicomonas euniceicola]UYM14834.1 hypothetical protein NX720_18355 [Endozoicomonas euniceicola]
MSLIVCKQITVRLAFFLLLSVATDWTFAQNITTTAISAVTVASTLSSLALAAKHNLTLCDTEVDSNDRSICRSIMKKLPASAQRYKGVKVYKEKWWTSAYITADTPDTIHIIDGDLTLGGPIMVTADNVVIIGSDNPQLKLSSTMLLGLYSIIYSTGNNLLVEGLQIDPKGLLLHHLNHVVNHFIQIKGGSASINNVSMLSAETANKAIILAEGEVSAENTSSLALTDVEIRKNGGNVHSYAVKTSGINWVSLKKIKTHNFISGCALFSFENARSIKLASIQSAIDNQKAPNASGILAIYTEPSSDIELDFENVSFSYKVTKQQSPVIIAAKDAISGQLSLAGENSFDPFAIRYPTGLTIFSEPREEPTGLTSTESTTASTTTITAAPSAPEYWWSDLPDCASSSYQEYPNLTNSTVTQWPVTATPHLSKTSNVDAKTPTTSITLASSSIQSSPKTTASSALTTEPSAVLSPGTIKPSSVVHSSPYQTTRKPTPSSQLSPDKHTTTVRNTPSAMPFTIKNRSAPVLSTRHDVNKGLTTRSPNVTDNTHSEVSSSDKSKAGSLTSALNSKYLGFIALLVIPIYAVPAIGCFKYKNTKSCATLNLLVLNTLKCTQYPKYMSIMFGQPDDYSADVELSSHQHQIYDSSTQLIENP